MFSSADRSYSGNAFKDIRSCVSRSVRELKRHDENFDTIVVSGVSGLMIGPSVAMKMGKHLCVIRKREEKSHSSRKWEGTVGDRFIFLDDFICVGDTMKSAVTGVRKAWRAEMMGYGDSWSESEIDERFQASGPVFAGMFSYVHSEFTTPANLRTYLNGYLSSIRLDHDDYMSVLDCGVSSDPGYW